MRSQTIVRQTRRREFFWPMPLRWQGLVALLFTQISQESTTRAHQRQFGAAWRGIPFRKRCAQFVTWRKELKSLQTMLTASRQHFPLQRRERQSYNNGTLIAAVRFAIYQQKSLQQTTKSEEQLHCSINLFPVTWLLGRLIERWVLQAQRWN